MSRIDEQVAASHPDGVSLESFDLNLLRVLDALLAARSVSGAARRLNLSQPATSAALSRLRQALRDLLLVRIGNRMTPTPLAEELGPRVARILKDVRDALHAAASFEPATTQRRFRIGANDYASLVVLAPVAARLRQLAPRATLEILPLDTAPDLGLATRALDVVIDDRWSLRGIRSLETLLHESFVSVARADHPRLPPRVTLEAFLAEDHALLAPRGMSSGIVDHALERMGHTRRVALTVPHYLVAPLIVAQTDLIMTLPRRIADCFADSHRLRIFPPPIALEGFDVAMAFDLRSEADPPVQWLKQLLRAIAGDVGKVIGRERIVARNQS